MDKMSGVVMALIGVALVTVLVTYTGGSDVIRSFGNQFTSAIRVATGRG